MKQLLKQTISSHKVTENDLYSILQDDFDPIAHEVVKKVLPILQINQKDKKVAELLEKWDGRFNVDSTAATFYTIFVSYLYQNFFGPNLENKSI